jgi:peptidoglycan hydrolase-like protein with peptidoglycan-binding domain
MSKKTNLTASQRDTLIRTAIGEAGGEGQEGMEAVIQVILNRAASGRYPSDPKDVALQKNQFSAWNSTSNGGNDPGKHSKTSKAYKAAEKALDAVIEGAPDRTGGALMYHAASITPYWADEANTNGTLKVGNHVFYPTHPVPPGSIPEVASETDTNPRAKGNIAGLQEELARRGFDPGPIDGDAGPRTESAIKAFQKANGLEADGVVGPKTQAALDASAMDSVTPRLGWADGEQTFDGREPRQVIPSEANARARLTAEYGGGGENALLAMLGQPARSLANVSEGETRAENALMRQPAPSSGLTTRKVSLVDIDPTTGLPRGQKPTWPESAPSPMPGRPASMDAGPQAKPFEAPAPLVAPKEPQSSGKVVRLASGKTITTGVHEGSNGRVQVSDDGNGNAVVTPIRAGLAGEADKNTLVGGLIRSKIGEVLPQAGQAIMAGAGNALTALPGVVSPVTQAGSDIISGTKVNLGGLWDKVSEAFGGQPSAAEPQMQPSHVIASSPESRFLSLVASPKDIPTEASTREEMGRGTKWPTPVAPTPMSGRPAGLYAQPAAARPVAPNPLAVRPIARAPVAPPKAKPTGYTASGTPLTSIAEASRWAAGYM